MPFPLLLAGAGTTTTIPVLVLELVLYYADNGLVATLASAPWLSKIQSSTSTGSSSSGCRADNPNGITIYYTYRNLKDLLSSSSLPLFSLSSTIFFSFSLFFCVFSCWIVFKTVPIFVTACLFRFVSFFFVYCLSIICVLMRGCYVINQR
jgi:hypothetical protein